MGDEEEGNHIGKQGIVLKVLHTKLRLIQWSRLVLMILSWGLGIIEVSKYFFCILLFFLIVLHRI